MFSAYAALVKNLRGVVLLDLDEKGVEESLKWLVKRFRYRNLGLTPLLVEKYENRLSKYLRGNPFRALVYPVVSIRGFFEKLNRVLGVRKEIVELLIFASTYISPGILIGNAYLNQLLDVSLSAVYTCRDLSVNEWKLHLRIADYTILDMYEWSMETAKHTISVIKEGKDASPILEERAHSIKEDKRRYWRISCEEENRLFMLYVDVLRLLVEKAENVLREVNEDTLATLAVVPIVHIPPGMKT